MAHRIGRKEEAAAGLLRLLHDDLAAAVRDFRDAGSREERVHRVRQRLKRARTLLRVLKPAVGDEADTLRRRLGETARMLSITRDADVAAASARDLASAAASPDLGFDRVVTALDEAAARAHSERTPIGEVSRRLSEAAKAVAGFEPSFDGDALVAEALHDTYARGRKAMREAQSSLATPAFHDWRKAVKQLWFLLRLARKRLPGKAAKLTGELEQLGEVLGRDNDHAMLAEKLALSPAGDVSLMAQLSLIAKRRNALEAEAFDLGARLYRRKPDNFAARVKLT